MQNRTSLDDPAKEFIEGILPSIPLLMYGSGDVAPNEVDASSAELVAILTTEYVSKLVRSAVDAHDILTNGEGGKLPPKPFKKRRKVHVAENNLLSQNNQLYEGDWDLPLPVPKIKKSSNLKTEVETNDNIKLSEDKCLESEQIIQGFDIYPDRIRNMYVTTPHTIGAQSFIFPCCHDAELYNRVQELKSFQNDLEATLVDSSISDFIRQEEERYDHLSQSVFCWMNSDGEPSTIEQKKKENARRLAVRTGLDVRFPGVEELLLQATSFHE